MLNHSIINKLTQGQEEIDFKTRPQLFKGG